MENAAIAAKQPTRAKFDPGFGLMRALLRPLPQLDVITPFGDLRAIFAFKKLTAFPMAQVVTSVLAKTAMSNADTRFRAFQDWVYAVPARSPAQPPIAFDNIGWLGRGAGGSICPRNALVEEVGDVVLDAVADIQGESLNSRGWVYGC